jgi:rhodanese-related sulfurtransferase
MPRIMVLGWLVAWHALTGIATSSRRMASPISSHESGFRPPHQKMEKALMAANTITPNELETLRRAGRSVELIDVRTPVEYREVHAEGARSVPLDQLEPKTFLNGLNGSKEEPLYVICRSGSRGRQAVEKFHVAGFVNVANVEGGTVAWERAGLPVVRGEKAMSLERQVRIAAGSLVVIATALGAFIHPGFLGLAAFVGAGLVFAGVTDTCGMGMVLARMPWNRATKAGEQCSHVGANR